jgi:hypothetical protein
VPGGYRVTANPPGQIAVTFLEDPDDLVFLFFSATGGLTPAQHEVLRQLIHFLDEGPGPGFANPVVKIVTGGLFPTDITWWDSDPGLFPLTAKRIIQKTIDRSTFPATLVKPTPVVWKIYDTDGVTVLETATDVITYTGVAETKRTRTFT